MTPRELGRTGRSPSKLRGAISESFLKRLADAIAFRRIDYGIQLLTGHREFIERFDPRQKHAGEFLGCLAQWVDIGFAKPDLIEKLLGRFDESVQRRLPLRDFSHLQMAAGFLDLCKQEDDNAIRHFKVVLAIERELPDRDLKTIANFWIGRCYRRQGRYADAVGYVIAAREAANSAGHDKTVAVIKALEGWVLYQEDRFEEGTKVLNEAEAVLSETDDYVARGNLNSVWGRISRRRGDHEDALRRFHAAIQEYRRRDEQHRNIARCLVNIAFVKRLLAFESSEKLDYQVSRARKRGRKRSARSSETSQHRLGIRLLRSEAGRHLEEARTIYAQHQDYSGRGNVEVSQGYLNLDDGDFDLASSRGAAAYRIAEENGDLVLKARARFLQSAIEYQKAEEQLGGSAAIRKCSRLSSDYARESWEIAAKTQNRPLIAQSYLTLGLALLNDGDIEGAHNCQRYVSSYLKTGSRDYLSTQLQQLRARLAKAGTVEPILREWSRGIIEKKTFQQVTEEFAALVIPKVWRREGYKVSAVAEQLSISPKKVRRILRNQGYLSPTNGRVTMRNSDVSHLKSDDWLAGDTETSLP